MNKLKIKLNYLKNYILSKYILTHIFLKSNFVNIKNGIKNKKVY